MRKEGDENTPEKRFTNAEKCVIIMESEYKKAFEKGQRFYGGRRTEKSHFGEREKGRVKDITLLADPTNRNFAQ